MDILTLSMLALVGFIQNMAFTAVSRSRNAGDVWYHFRIALVSNSVWFICNFFILFGTMLKAVTSGDTFGAIITLLVYSVFTALGSVFMMAIQLGKIKFPKGFKWLGNYLVETGKKKVGAR